MTDAWAGYCVATFTSDTPLPSVFGGTGFVAHTGEQYLMTRYIDGPAVEIAYLTTLGPYTLTVPVANGQPFSSNCTIATAAQYYAAFTDVTVYSAEDLGTKICEIAGGTALPRDMAAPAGASLSQFGTGGPLTYDVMLNVFSSQCGNASNGFVSVPETVVLGTHTWLVPIDVVLKPN